MNRNNINASYENDIRIVIPKEKIQENIIQESFLVKLLRKLKIF